MLATLVTAAVAYIFYLLMTLGSGTVGAWSVEELISGAVLAVIAGLIAGGIAISKEESGG